MGDWVDLFVEVVCITVRDEHGRGVNEECDIIVEAFEH